MKEIPASSAAEAGCLHLLRIQPEKEDVDRPIPAGVVSSDAPREKRAHEDPSSMASICSIRSVAPI